MKLLFVFCMIMFPGFSEDLQAQKTVNEIYTDYGGWWTSGASQKNTAVKPDDTHNLLAFGIDGTVYSTGVDNGLLSDKGIRYVSLLFFALPVKNMGEGGIIGVGRKHSGAVVNDPVLYLTDGKNGLDLSTGIFNGNGSNTYSIESVNPATIDDGIPDILIPQIGDPSASLDKFRFIDAEGKIVGKELSVKFTGIGSIGYNNWSFYSRATPPKIGAAAAGDRDLRMIVYEYSDFGITGSNYTNIKAFVHQLSGTSDQPFIAYNMSSFRVTPVKVLQFSASKQERQAIIKWSISSEGSAIPFTLERSPDDRRWTEICGIQNATSEGKTGSESFYSFKDENPVTGENFYRIKFGYEGSVEYTKTLKLNFDADIRDFSFYPNPVKNLLVLKGLKAGDSFIITNLTGKMLLRGSAIEDSTVRLEISNIPMGIYLIRFFNSGSRSSKDYQFVKE